MAEIVQCTYCPAQFCNNESFWAHIDAGTCNTTTVAEVSSSQPLPDTDQFSLSPASSQESPQPKNNGILPNGFPYPQPQLPTNIPSHFSQYTQRSSVSQSQEIKSNILEHDFNKKMNVVPTFHVPPFSAPQLTTPQNLSLNVSSTQQMIMQPIHNNNLSTISQQASTMSSKPVVQSSPVGNSNSLVSQSRVWKCTLCMVSFTDRVTLMNHVKSSEHKAKIPSDLPPPTVKTTPVINGSNSFSNNVTPYQPLTNGFALSSPNSEPTAPIPTGTEDLESMIRRICREELSRVLRKELRSLFLPALQEPVMLSITNNTLNTSFPTADVSSTAGPLKPLGPPIMDYDIENGGMIEMRGGTMHCLVCDIDVSSQGNLEAHLLGKKHKSGLIKLGYV